MRELIEVELSNGHTMWTWVEAGTAPHDVGIFDRVSGLPGFAEVLDWVGTGLTTGLRHGKPDRVTAEFGIELAVGDKGVVAALGGVGGRAHVKVTLGWGDAGPPPPLEPPGPATDPAPAPRPEGETGPR